ncbi:crocetin glucosyltransferase, chloroplastic-like [Fagus crenata]
MVQRHFLLVTFPAQGHINPTLQFAKRLISLGAHVTFATSVSAHRRMTKSSPPPNGLSFASFSDGYDDGVRPEDDSENHLNVLKQNGSKTLTDLIVSSANQGRPFNCVVYTLLLPWAADVARELHVPSALLWIQPAMVLDIYYYYFNGFANVISEGTKDPSCLIQLPGLPLLTSRDLPSFLLASNTHAFALLSFQAQIEALEKETHLRVLVNTFDALEPEALTAIKKLNLVGVGPLIPSAFLDGKDPSDKSFGGDLIQTSKDHYYIEWLNSKAESSVVYVSFGSLSVLTKPQMEELARGLLESGHNGLATRQLLHHRSTGSIFST